MKCNIGDTVENADVVCRPWFPKVDLIVLRAHFGHPSAIKLTKNRYYSLISARREKDGFENEGAKFGLYTILHIM